MEKREMSDPIDRLTVSWSDLSDAIRVICQVSIPATSGESRMAATVDEMATVIRAESACIYESRGRFPSVMTELFPHNWHDWQTDAIAASMNGKRVRDVVTASRQFSCVNPLLGFGGRWHFITSCLSVRENHLLTLAFARPNQAFPERELKLLRSLHEAGVFDLFAEHRSAPEGTASSPRSRQVGGRSL
jgi:hypothetical protein